MPRRKVLLISYLFPPVGGVGVHRNLKYVKYLPQFGWEPHVLTVKDIHHHVYDRSLLKEIPPEAHILRTESLDPLRLASFILPAPRDDAAGEGAVRDRLFNDGSLALRAYQMARNFFAIPDASAGWIPFAYRKGVETIRKQNIDAVVASIGPASSAIVAHLLWKKTGVPYLLDFRDGWTDDPYTRCPTRLHLRIHRFLEKRTIDAASAVCTMADALLKTLTTRYPGLSERASVLHNGYDPADFDAIVPVPRPQGMRRIVYMGSLFAHHEPNFLSLLTAIQSLPEKLRDTLEVLFVGRTYAGAHQRVAAAGLEGRLKFTGYLPHLDALNQFASADAALLFIRPGDNMLVTAKVYEYFMMQRPILGCVEPNGPCVDLLREAGHSQWIVPPEDPRLLAERIVALDKAGWPRPEAARLDQFSRKRNTQRLAELLDRIRERPAVPD